MFWQDWSVYELTWPVLSERVFLSERRRETITEVLYSEQLMSWVLKGREVQLAEMEACSWSGDKESVCFTGTETGMTNGMRTSSLGRLALTWSTSATPRPGPVGATGGLQGLCRSCWKHTINSQINGSTKVLNLIRMHPSSALKNNLYAWKNERVLNSW